MKKQGVVVSLSAEAYQDSDKASSFAYVDPPGERTTELKKLKVGVAYSAGNLMSEV